MKRLISIIISLAILIVIYWKIDFRGLIPIFKNSDWFWMIISLGMVIPLTLVTSWRFQKLLPKQTSLSFGEANQLILVASVLNMVLPSKMGDIAKAYFIRDRGHLDGALALSLVVFEKACDMLSLLLWCAFGLFLYPHKDALFWAMTTMIFLGFCGGLLLLGSSTFAELIFTLGLRFGGNKVKSKVSKLKTAWGEMHGYFWSNKKRLFDIAVTSVGLWFLHLMQIWFFIFALKSTVPFLVNLALSPLAILAGLLPLTFAGVGTRDGALIYFYGDYFDAHTAAALGLLCTARYLLPALAGLPFLHQYIGKLNPNEARM